MNRLTGGSKDVNPQFFNMRMVLDVTDQLTEASFAVPITRLPQTNRVTIMEVLKVFWMPHVWRTGAIPMLKQEQMFSLSTIAQGAGVPPAAFAEFSEGNVFCQMELEHTNIVTAGGTGFGYAPYQPGVVDLTDGAGHGILIAGDRIYMQAITVVMTPTVAVFNVKILYRFKTVNLAEYVGIVQSQQ